MIGDYVSFLGSDVNETIEAESHDAKKSHLTVI